MRKTLALMIALVALAALAMQQAHAALVTYELQGQLACDQDCPLFASGAEFEADTGFALDGALHPFTALVQFDASLLGEPGFSAVVGADEWLSVKYGDFSGSFTNFLLGVPGTASGPFSVTVAPVQYGNDIGRQTSIGLNGLENFISHDGWDAGGYVSSIVAVPEPGVLSLFAAGLVATFVARRRRQATRQALT